MLKAQGLLTVKEKSTNALDKFPSASTAWSDGTLIEKKENVLSEDEEESENISDQSNSQDEKNKGSRKGSTTKKVLSQQGKVIGRKSLKKSHHIKASKMLKKQK